MKSWDVQKIRSNFSPSSAIKVLQTPIAWHCEADLLWWPNAKSGDYSVKSGYFNLKNAEQRVSTRPSSSYGMNGGIWKSIWRVKVPQKIKHFLWKLCHNSIPVLANLWKKKLINSALCPICFQEAETIEHTFLLCEWTRSVWFGLQIQCNPDRNNISTLHDWMNRKFEEFSRQNDFKEFAISSLCCALWSIWKERNLVVFEKKNPNPTATVIRANILHNDYFSFWSKNVREPDTHDQTNFFSKAWRPPPKGMLKLNTDASFNQGKNTAYAGIIIRNEKGDICTGLTKIFPATSPLLAEALSLREAMLFAESMGIQRLIVESDCLELIRACREEIKLGEIFSLVKDILSIRNNFQQIGFTWISRDGNKVAHHIAMLASHKSLPANWIRILPPSLKNLIQNDVCMTNNFVFHSRRGGLDFTVGNGFQNEPERGQHSVLSRSGYPFDPGWRQGNGESSENRSDLERA